MRSIESVPGVRYEKSYVLKLLNKLCFYNTTIKLQASIKNIDWQNEAEIAYQYALACKMISSETIGKSSMANFEQIVDLAPSGSEVKINALYQRVIHFVKDNYNP